MIIPYSTDAPIYHFPWMTIALIVINCLTFALTGMGANNDGWLLQYGNGLHPLEWVAYNFLHFGIGHLVGNMFFLWAFGIVVEGKLGWWKFLSVYMTIGIAGGFLIQLTMLGYKPAFDFGDLGAAASQDASRAWSWLEPTPVFAQDDEGDDGPDMAPAGAGLPAGPFPGNGLDPDGDGQVDPKAMKELQRALLKMNRPGAGGASLVVFALLGIVLVWAPKNEISCLWIGINAGTFEVEYVYFCGFKIGTEILGSVFGAHGYEVTSEIAHALGAILGFGVGAAFVQLHWVDCENWDLFAYAQNKHGSMEHVGSWQDTAALASLREKKLSTPNRDDDDEPRILAGRKKRAMPKLRSLSSLDDEVPDEPEEEVYEVEDFEDSDGKPARTKKSQEAAALKAQSRPPVPPMPVPPIPVPPIPVKPVANAKPTSKPTASTKPAPAAATSNPPLASRSPLASSPLPNATLLLTTPADSSPLDLIRSAIQIDKPNDALAVLRRQRASDATFQLPMAELRALADAFFKLQNVRDSKPLLEEFIERFPKESDRQRVKLAVLNVKFLKRPTAALKLLAPVDRSWLPDEYQSIHKEAARQAQHMVSEGIVDAS